MEGLHKGGGKMLGTFGSTEFGIYELNYVLYSGPGISYPVTFSSVIRIMSADISGREMTKGEIITR